MLRLSTHDSLQIKAKALWLLGEMGLVYPESMQIAVEAIAVFLDSPEPLLRERAVNFKSGITIDIEG